MTGLILSEFFYVAPPMACPVLFGDLLKNVLVTNTLTFSLGVDSQEYVYSTIELLGWLI